MAKQPRQPHVVRAQLGRALSYLTWQRLTGIGVSALALAWLVTKAMLRTGATPATVPWTVHVVAIAAGAVALWLGWQVRAYLKGDKPNLDGLRAARTAVFAQACAYVGAILTGAYAGYALGLADMWGHEPRREVIVSALLAAVTSLVMLVAGVVAENWCRNDRDGDSPSREGAERTGPSPA